MDEEDSSITNVYKLLGLGMGMAVQALAGSLVGYFLDKILQTQPWLLLLGTAGGFILGLRALFSTLKRL